MYVDLVLYKPGGTQFKPGGPTVPGLHRISVESVILARPTPSTSQFQFTKNDQYRRSYHSVFLCQDLCLGLCTKYPVQCSTQQYNNSLVPTHCRLRLHDPDPVDLVIQLCTVNLVIQFCRLCLLKQFSSAVSILEWICCSDLVLACWLQLDCACRSSVGWTCCSSTSVMQ